MCLRIHPCICACIRTVCNSTAESSHMGDIMGPSCGIIKLTRHGDLAPLEVDGSTLTFKVICLSAPRESESPQGHDTACWPLECLSITGFNFPSTAGPLPLVVTFLQEMCIMAAFLFVSVVPVHWQMPLLLIKPNLMCLYIVEKLNSLRN